jgi:ribosome-associated heat shock protein Hsp15
MGTADASGRVRVDQWLWACRFFKSRTLAGKACAAGRVRMAGAAVKASHVVRVGDRVEVEVPRGRLALEVAALGTRRVSPALARELYVDHTPVVPRSDETLLAVRERGAGRPTKRDRRLVDALRRG